MNPTVAASAALVAGICLASSGIVRAADSTVPGHIVIARSEGDALVIWDSTPEVTSIVSAKLSDADATTRLEHDALHVLAQAAPKVPASKTITVRILYSKTGAVSPIYGTPTFAGVERYATLKVKTADAASDRDKWKEIGDQAAPPAWMQFDVVGQLPPR